MNLLTCMDVQRLMEQLRSNCQQAQSNACVIVYTTNGTLFANIWPLFARVPKYFDCFVLVIVGTSTPPKWQILVTKTIQKTILTAM